MKKVKFMLLSLALVAVVGGALAFKVKNDKHFCTTKAILVNGVTTCRDAGGALLKCPNATAIVTTLNGDSPTFYCTTPDNDQPCDQNTICEPTTRQTKDGD